MFLELKYRYIIIYQNKSVSRLEEFEESKGVIRNRKSKNDRQYNGQKKKEIGTKNELQNTTEKTKDRATQTLLKTGDELMCSGRVNTSCTTYDTRRVNVKRHEHHPTWNSRWTPIYINKMQSRRFEYSFTRKS